VVNLADLERMKNCSNQS